MDRTRNKDGAVQGGLRSYLAVGFWSLVLGVLLSLPSALGMPGAGATPSRLGGVALDAIGDVSQGVAATVNGSPVGEAVVTSYIGVMREGRGLVNDADWAIWLGENGLDSQGVRSDVIDFYTSLAKLRLAAGEQGVTVDGAEVDEALEEEQAGYGSRGEWLEALSGVGSTEELERLVLESKLLQKKLTDVVASADVDDDTVMAYVELLKEDWEGELPDYMSTIEQVPDELASLAREQAESDARTDSFNMWVYQWMASVDVITNDMPSGLPYDVEPVEPAGDADPKGAAEPAGGFEPAGAVRDDGEGQ